MIIPFLITSIWIVCGILHYGIYLAYLQRKFPLIAKEQYETDVMLVLALSLLGPFSLLLAIIGREYRYGIKFANRGSVE